MDEKKILVSGRIGRFSSVDGTLYRTCRGEKQRVNGRYADQWHFRKSDRRCREPFCNRDWSGHFPCIVFDFIWRLHCGETAHWRGIFFFKNSKPNKMGFKGICLAVFLQRALHVLLCGNAHVVFHLGKQRSGPIRDTFQGRFSDWTIFDAAIVSDGCAV